MSDDGGWQQCPICKLLSPPAVELCSCGWNFYTKTFRQPHLPLGAVKRSDRKSFNIFKASGLLRYPLAIAIIIVSIALYANYPKNFIGLYVLIAVLIALALMRELVWLAILCAVGYAVVAGIAALPISLAIIIGAIIIANASKNN